MKRKIFLVMGFICCMLMIACDGARNNGSNQDAYVSEGSHFFLKDGSEIASILSSGYSEQYDEVEESHIYVADRPWGVEENTSGGIYPVVTVKGEDKTTGVQYVYSGYDWVFFDKLIIKTDDNKYEKYFDFNEVKTNTRSLGGVHVEEAAFRRLDSDTYEMLKDIAESSKTILRFSGENGTMDRELTELNLAQIKIYLNCFVEY